VAAVKEDPKGFGNLRVFHNLDELLAGMRFVKNGKLEELPLMTDHLLGDLLVPN